MSVHNDNCMENLPPSASPAWAAYTAMGASKKRHFDYLQHLERKYEKYGQPSAQEQATLASLLQEHDTQVTAFKSAVQKLKITDPGAYAALVTRLSVAGSESA